MRTALATDEPDEPERKRYLTSVATGMANLTYTYPATGGNVGAALPPQPPTTTATFPQRVVGPWQCPDCHTWMAPTVTEHRCST